MFDDNLLDHKNLHMVKKGSNAKLLTRKQYLLLIVCFFRKYIKNKLHILLLHNFELPLVWVRLSPPKGLGACKVKPPSGVRFYIKQCFITDFVLQFLYEKGSQVNVIHKINYFFYHTLLIPIQGWERLNSSSSIKDDSKPQKDTTSLLFSIICRFK